MHIQVLKLCMHVNVILIILYKTSHIYFLLRIIVML
jgi:hypothetical protein